MDRARPLSHLSPIVAQVATTDGTQQADEWCLALHVPADLPDTEVARVRAVVVGQLARLTGLRLPSGCVLGLSSQLTPGEVPPDP